MQIKHTHSQQYNLFIGLQRSELTITLTTNDTFFIKLYKIILL